MRLGVVIFMLMIFSINAIAGNIENYDKFNLLPQNSFLGNNLNSTNLDLGKIKLNSNTSIEIGLSADVNQWNYCAGRYALNSKCIDSQFNNSSIQPLLGPKVSFKSSSSEGGIESDISYTSSKNLPVDLSETTANMSNLKLDSSINLNLSPTAQLKFIGEYKHNNIDSHPNNIIDNIPKDEYGVGLKLNIGF